MTPTNTITVSAFRRPFHTRLCLEAICRAQRWFQWADQIYICIPETGPFDIGLIDEIGGVIERNQDIPLVILIEPASISRSPHTASKWMMDHAFGASSDFNLYIEDDVILAIDAFVLLQAFWIAHYTGRLSDKVIGVCLYHETIPDQYAREGRRPDPRLLHLGNGVNTCGGTAFLRDPYLRVLAPEWNCKRVEPKGFDYSAHYLMYLHGLYMAWPDYSRSMNCGFESGSISQTEWAKYFGKSIWAQTAQAARRAEEFLFDVEGPETYPGLVREPWMLDEMRDRGLL